MIFDAEMPWCNREMSKLNKPFSTLRKGTFALNGYNRRFKEFSSKQAVLVKGLSVLSCRKENTLNFGELQ